MKTLLLFSVLFSGLSFGQSKKTFSKQELFKLYDSSYLNEVYKKEGMNAFFNQPREYYVDKAYCLMTKYKYKKKDFVHFLNEKEFKELNLKTDYVLADTVTNMGAYPPNGADIAPKCFPEQLTK
ncbi:hypothetical protein BFF93_09050 [Elizabethkingia meningoseptica]|uniref:hypothetical protein n=1 Tax=Elizabethkingia meningoseptica TaxID=238 RepID=UPI0008418C4F|nr:hypothetical protein [Elizabethkingia meningoseptica]ODM54327.1 hypothetical protein BES09_09045 [Elizabethkingia meningoseptica]OHT29552.1 hypothetical protein BFF93_09050 [Elizabethkingia meningoseptica]